MRRLSHATLPPLFRSDYEHQPDGYSVKRYRRSRFATHPAVRPKGQLTAAARRERRASGLAAGLGLDAFTASVSGGVDRLQDGDVAAPHLSGGATRLSIAPFCTRLKKPPFGLSHAQPGVGAGTTKSATQTERLRAERQRESHRGTVRKKHRSWSPRLRRNPVHRAFAQSFSNTSMSALPDVPFLPETMAV